MSTDSKPRRGRTNLASGKPKVQPIADPADLAMERGLPANLDAERFVLGSILLNDARFAEVDLNPNDFALERHRRIFARMIDLLERGQRIDRVTVAEELSSIWAWPSNEIPRAPICRIDSAAAGPFGAWRVKLIACPMGVRLRSTKPSRGNYAV